MSSNSGSTPRRSRPRDSQTQDDFPPLPTTVMSSLRSLPASRERDMLAQEMREYMAISSSPTFELGRPQSRYSTAYRRAERIRLLDSQFLERASAAVDRAAEHALPNPYIHPRPPRLPAYLNDVETLGEANSHLRALLDLSTDSDLASPQMPLPESPYPPPPRAHDFSDDNRRNKRRKLDSDKAGPSSRGFRYGKYGQVEPGQLRMEMVSCDGGMFSNESLYAAENILKDDSSVYCTKGNRCNIVLRHQGSTLFTLEELVIKAPGAMNYSHPVREGMVFIGMDEDDALSNTAQYQIQYAAKARDGSLQDNGEDDRHPPPPRHIVSIRHHEDGTTSTRTRRSLNPRDHDEDCFRTPQMPNEFSANVPEFNITTACSDDEEDDCEVRSSRRRPPNRIGSLPFENNDSDSDDHLYFPFGSEDFDDMPRRRRDRDRDRDRSRPDASLTEAWEAHASATQDAKRAVGGELLTPHARFFIEKKKSKCTIRFDPPVSGRFILLKMWSTQHDPGSNIDIQSVIARGFAGPRYFPSVSVS